MVYIHGGAGGAFGSGQRYGAEYFMDANVTLITLEYRLGVLGTKPYILFDKSKLPNEIKIEFCNCVQGI